MGQRQGGSEFSLFSTPAAATQATASKVAGSNGTRHVLDSLSATLATGATAQATAVRIVVRDGLTGAGTILYAKQVILPANAVWEVSIDALRILGSPNTAMTVEFDVAGAAGTFESFGAIGHEEN